MAVIFKTFSCIEGGLKANISQKFFVSKTLASNPAVMHLVTLQDVSLIYLP
jgi:hypothetical protein